MVPFGGLRRSLPPLVAGPVPGPFETIRDDDTSAALCAGDTPLHLVSNLPSLQRAGNVVRCDTDEMTAAPIEDSGWTESGDGLGRELRFADFSAAWAFMTRVALIAEKLDHHPDWSNSWSTVRITLRSHDAGNTVTARDRRMAEEIDRLLG